MRTKLTPLPLRKFRNAIITALIDGDLSRGEISRKLQGGKNDSNEDAQIGTALRLLVSRGDIVRPFHGQYALKRRTDDA